MAGTSIRGREIWLPAGVPVTSPASLDSAPKKEFFLHYSAFAGMNVDTKAEQIATMRAIRHQHVNVNGWDDIGYSFVVFQPYGAIRRPKVYEGRGWKRLPAAQGGHNTGTIAVCVVALTEDIKPRTVKILASLFEDSPCSVVRGHREVTATGCPGDKLFALRSEVQKGVPDSPDPVPAPAPPAYPGTPVKEGSTGRAVKLIQDALNIKIDGVFGPATKRAVVNFQNRKNMIADGIVGPRTWKALFGG